MFVILVLICFVSRSRMEETTNSTEQTDMESTAAILDEDDYEISMNETQNATFGNNTVTDFPPMNPSEEVPSKDIAEVTRIVGGEDTTQNEFPFMVRLRFYRTNGVVTLCAGSLIHPKYIISAAHCYFKTPEIKYSKIHAVLGAYFTRKRTRSEKVVLIDKCMRPPPGEKTKYFGVTDIMICEFASAVSFNEAIQTACVTSTNSERRNFWATTIGWGCSNYRGGKPDVLQKVELLVHSNQVCQEKMTFFTPNYSICAGDLSGRKSTCRGDSGGPIFIKVVNKYLVFGLTSGGVQKMGQLRIFTKVAHYADWIHSTVPDDGEICYL